MKLEPGVELPPVLQPLHGEKSYKLAGKALSMIEVFVAGAYCCLEPDTINFLHIYLLTKEFIYPIKRLFLLEFCMTLLPADRLVPSALPGV